MDYCDEWFALEMNRDHSVILEIASKYCILDSLVDYEAPFDLRTSLLVDNDIGIQMLFLLCFHV